MHHIPSVVLVLVLATTTCLCFTEVPGENGEKTKCSVELPNADPNPFVNDGYPTQIVDVTQFGAKGDGLTYDTNAIQKTIDVASEYDNGALVYFPPGMYLSGALFMKSNAYLYLPAQTTLFAATHWDYYPYDPSQWAFIAGFNVSNTGIIGDGVINGQCHKYIKIYEPYNDRLVAKTWEGIHGCTGECRPRLVQFVASTNVTLHGSLGLINSPDWTSHFWGCDNVYIDGITVFNPFAWVNGDGIDPDCSRHVIIRNVFVHSGDDGICFKSRTNLIGGNSSNHNYGDMYDVLVENAVIRSHESGIKFGSGTHYNIYDITVRNVRIVTSNRGIGVQMRDNGTIHNVTFENINIETQWSQANGNRWWGNAEPIWITAGTGNDGTATGRVYDMWFKNITTRSENGILISGYGGLGAVSDIHLLDINMIIDKWSEYSHPSRDYRPSPNHIIPSNVSAIYIEESEDIELNGVQISFFSPDQQSYWDQCLFVDEVSTVTTKDLQCNQP